jgi:hypothetical protein
MEEEEEEEDVVVGLFLFVGIRRSLSRHGSGLVRGMAV